MKKIHVKEYKRESPTNVVLKRASYAWGKFSTPKSKREYTIESINNQPVYSSAVGTISEISKFLLEGGHGKVIFEIHDKNTIVNKKSKFYKSTSAKRGDTLFYGSV